MGHWEFSQETEENFDFLKKKKKWRKTNIHHRDSL